MVGSKRTPAWRRSGWLPTSHFRPPPNLDSNCIQPLHRSPRSRRFLASRCRPMEGLRRMLTRDVIVTAFVFIILTSSRVTAFEVQNGKHGGEQIAASVNGDTITTEQLEAMIKAQVEPLNRQIEQIRESALQRLIDNLLVEQAARGEGTTVHEYLRKQIEAVQVPDAEVEEVYENGKEHFAGFLAPEAKYRIRRRMEDQRYAGSLRQLLANLRQKGKVRNFLAEAATASLNLRAEVGPSRGNPDAPVTVVAFNDFECPYCRRDQQALNGIMEKWPDEVRLVFKHFPLGFHPNAFQAALAGVCAERQGRFWEFQEIAFQDGQDLSRPGLAVTAGSLGFDVEAFRNCMASPEAAERVRENMATGQAARVDGTPAYFVNNRRVRGASELEGTIAEILSQRR